MAELFKRPVVIVIFLLALTSAIIWSYIDNRRQSKNSNLQSTTEATTIVNLTNVDATDFDSAVKAELELAESKAVEVNSQNKLAASQYELPADLLPNSGLSRYIFSAENDKNNNWSITISQDSSNYIRALIPKADYLGEMPAVNSKLMKFNYVTALQIAEKNGGLEWREKNELAGVKLTLRHTSPKNWLTWTIEYQGKEQFATLKKNIDANSGQIIENP